MPASQSRLQIAIEQSLGAPCLALRLVRNEDLLPLSPVHGAALARCSSSSRGGHRHSYTRQESHLVILLALGVAVVEDLVPEVCRPRAPRKAPPPKRCPHPYPPRRRCREGYKIGTRRIRNPFLGLHFLSYAPHSAPISRSWSGHQIPNIT